MNARQILRITGPDRVEFLQGLVTNDVTRAPVYAAILSPQGKYLADFFIVPEDDALLLDVDATQAADVSAKLLMYRLRSKVEIGPDPREVSSGQGKPPANGFADPRHPDLGWRLCGPAGDDATNWASSDWDRVRVRHLVPQAGIELISNDSYILEMGFERLNGVDFRKGCYVGQEVTARMKHKTELRKGLGRVRLGAPVPVGTLIETEDGREAGTVFTQSDGLAIAYLRFDRARGAMTAAGQVVSLE